MPAMRDRHERGLMGATRRPPRIFVGPIEIAGYYTRLAASLRDLGVDAIAVDLSGHPFSYERGPKESVWIRLAEGAGCLDAATSGRPRLLRVPFRALSLLARIPLFLWCLARFDVFVFGFGQTFFYTLELPLLRIARKRLIFVFNGSDARPPYVDGAIMSRTSRRSAADCIRITARQKQRIRTIERHAHAIVSQPAFSHFFERPVVDFFRIGVPWVQSPVVATEPRDGTTIRILHSPSDPEVKGTRRIREVIAELMAAGHRLELIELQGAPNAVVRREIAGCDFVIDQIYSDAPMVGFATESAAAGRPAIVGGYAWPELQRIYDSSTMPPVEACRPEELADAVVRLASDAEYRHSLGARARQFVHEQWAPKKIAERYLKIIDGEVPADLMFDPRSLGYVRGVGLEEERARELVAAVLARGGRKALQLADKPELEQRFVDFGEGRG